jgi:hypothetical protein
MADGAFSPLPSPGEVFFPPNRLKEVHDRLEGISIQMVALSGYTGMTPLEGETPPLGSGNISCIYLAGESDRGYRGCIAFECCKHITFRIAPSLRRRGWEEALMRPTRGLTASFGETYLAGVAG